MRQVSVKIFVLALCIMLVSFTGNYAYAENIVYIQAGKTKSLTATNVNAAAYQWYKDGKPILDAFGRVFIATEPGDYTVRGFNQESCPSELSDPITIKIADNAVPDLWITAQSYSRAYGSENLPVKFLYKGFKGSDDQSVLTKLPTANTSATINSGAGAYSIVPEGASSDKYNIHYVGGALTVTKAPLIITANSVVKTADGIVYSPKNDVTVSGFANDDTINSLTGSLVFSGNAVGATAPGKYTMLPSGLSSDNYAITYMPGTVTILNNEVDLAVNIYTGGKNATIGEMLEYTITLVNKSETDASNVVVKNTLPAEFDFIKTISVTYGNTVYDPATRLLTWSAGDFKARDKSELVVQVKANKSGTAKSIAIVNSAQRDTYTDNNTASAIQVVNSFTIPNIFTPNGDGINDYFVIPALANYPDNEINIFNRAGNNVYTSKSYKNDWMGSGLSDGTYFYILKVRMDNEKTEVYKGYVTMLRSNMKQINL